MIYLLDILLLSFTAFGGPQVHLMMMIERLVKKKEILNRGRITGIAGAMPGIARPQLDTDCYGNRP